MIAAHFLRTFTSRVNAEEVRLRRGTEAFKASMKKVQTMLPSTTSINGSLTSSENRSLSGVLRRLIS